MKTWIVSSIRKFLGINQDKEFLLAYGDAISSRVDNLDQQAEAVNKN